MPCSYSLSEFVYDIADFNCISVVPLLRLCISTVSVLSVVTVTSVILNVILTCYLVRERRAHEQNSARRARLAVKKTLQRIHTHRDDTSDERNTSTELEERKSLIRDESHHGGNVTGSGDEEDDLFLAPILPNGRKK